MNLSVIVVCVADKEGEAMNILSKAKTFLEGYKLTVQTISKGGYDHAGGILNVCNDEDRNFDLLVMGAYGHSRIQEMILGSTTVRVMRETNCPILLCILFTDYLHNNIGQFVSPTTVRVMRETNCPILLCR